MNTQVLCGDFATNVGLKKEGATVLIRNPLPFLVAGLDLNQRPLGYEGNGGRDGRQA
jgi:hypothetical protein